MSNLKDLFGPRDYHHLMREVNEFNQRKDEKKQIGNFDILLNDKWGRPLNDKWGLLFNKKNDNGEKTTKTTDVDREWHTDFLNINTAEEELPYLMPDLLSKPKKNESTKNTDSIDVYHSSLDFNPNNLARLLSVPILGQPDYGMPSQSYGDKNRCTNALYTNTMEEQLPPPSFTTQTITIPNTNNGFYNDDRIDSNIPIWDNPDVMLDPVPLHKIWQRDFSMPNTSYIEPQAEDPRDYLESLAYVFAEEATINELKEIEKLTNQKKIIELQIWRNKFLLNTPQKNIGKENIFQFLPFFLSLDKRKEELAEEIKRFESERNHKKNVYKREFYAEMGRTMTSYWINERAQVIPWFCYLNIGDLNSVPINLVASDDDGHIINTDSYGQYVSYSKREIKLPDNHFNDKNFLRTYSSSIHENSHSLDDSFNIGEGVYVGTGAKIINQLEIGEYTIVGAGAVVAKTLPAKCTAVGVPAKPIKFHDKQ